MQQHWLSLSPRVSSVLGKRKAENAQLDMVPADFSSHSGGIMELQEVQLDIAPILAAHDNKIYTFPGLFEKIAAVHARRRYRSAHVAVRAS